MLYIGAHIKIIDNSGARIGGLIKMLKNKHGGIGNVCILSVKQATPNKKVKKHTIQRALIVRTGNFSRRRDGSYLRWQYTSSILINKQNLPIGKRIIGPVDKKLREMGHLKLISIASIAI